MKFRALVPVVLTLALAACVAADTSAWELAAFPLTNMPDPVVDLSAAPAGWVPVVYGDAQVSVPPTWWVLYNSSACATGSPVGDMYVNPSGGFCSAKGTPKGEATVTSVPLNEREYQPPSAYGQRQVINGIVVYALYSFAPTPNGGSYLVPSLGVEIEAEGPLAKRVVGTLTHSPRSVALASGSSPAVPSSWRYVSFAGLRFSVPANWPINQTQVTPGLGAICRQQGVAFAGTTVTLSTDRHPLLAVFCPRMSPTPQQPENGVQVDSGLRTEPTVTLSFSAHCLDLNGLTACPATSPAYSILVLGVTVPGRKKPDFVSIGLAGNGIVARTILYSLRAASDSAVTPASFLARAKAGIEGTFSAVYKLSAPSSSTESDATVTVAQRAVSGSTSWPGGKPGEWSYRLTYADGSTVEWLVRGNLLVTCLRVSRSKWRCSAGHYNGDAGSIGYTIATIPYLPGTAFLSLSIALQAMRPPESS